MQLLIRHSSNLTLEQVTFAGLHSYLHYWKTDTVMFLNVLCKYINVLFIPIGCSTTIEFSRKYFLCIQKDLVFFPATAGSPYKPDISLLLS